MVSNLEVIAIQIKMTFKQNTIANFDNQIYFVFCDFSVT